MVKNPAPQNASIRSFASRGRNAGDQLGQGFGDCVVGLRKDARTRMRAQRVMTIAHSSRAQLRESIIHFGRGDRAALDVHQLVDIAPVESDDVVLRVDGDPVPITVGQRRGDDGLHGRLR